MSVFVYKPEEFNAWAKTVINCLEGGSESVLSCLKRFNEQLEALVQPNVWTGTAAQANYQDFLTVHNYLVEFTNIFGEDFRNGIKEVSSDIASMEATNLGDTSTLETFGSLSFDRLQELSATSLNTTDVIYDYAKITEIGGNLNQVRNELETVKGNINREISKLNTDESGWKGDRSNSAKEYFTQEVNNYMKKVFDALDICISNIKTAAENARVKDQAQF